MSEPRSGSRRADQTPAGVIRWGMVSAGNIAGQFARDIKLVDNARVDAVAARSGDDARRFASEHDIPRALEGYESLYNDPDIDAVYISTPHTFHLQHSIDALAAGKAVLCEKPITTSGEELDRLLAAAKTANGYIMEAMWTWFLPAINRAREWVDEGRIGTLLHVKADFGFAKQFNPESRLYNPELAGGCLLDMGIYPIALARLFFTGEPNAMNALCRFAPNGVEDDVVMQFNYDSGVASLGTSMRTTLPNEACLIGTDGYIRLPFFWSARSCELYKNHECVETFNDERTGGGFEFQLEQVSADLLEGRTESKIVTHRASRAFQTDMDRVRQQFKASLHDQGD